MTRPADKQLLIDAQTTKLVLYQFDACPFCVKVRRHLKRKNLKIELRDARGNETFRKELTEQGGNYQAPCLRIDKDDGKIEWLYESSDIIAYIDSRFA